MKHLLLLRDGSCANVSYQVYYNTGELIRRCETEGCVNLTGEIQTHVISDLNSLNTGNCEVVEGLTKSGMANKLQEGYFLNIHVLRYCCF